MNTSLTVVDLFCGAGGLALGFERVGFTTIAAFDNNEAATRTYSSNLGVEANCASITEETPLPSPLVIIGGPPCQGFSSAGLRRIGDNRNTLVSIFAGLVVKYRPTAFLFENVEGFLTAEKGKRVMELLLPLISAGYRIQLRKINAANYGVPQHRKRVIAIGGLGWDPLFPEPTHRAFGAPGAAHLGSSLPMTPTVAETLAGLPSPTDSPPGFPPDHCVRKVSADHLIRIRSLKPGQRMRDLPEELWHPSYRRRAFRRVMDGTPTERRGGAPAGLLRLHRDQPSKAITAGAVSELVHPVEDRCLTIRECALLQTFPSDYAFSGSASERILQIGNSVPPLLAEAFARSLREGLQQNRRLHRDGALLSFVPTVSNGMSPVLALVTDLVLQEFGPAQTDPEQLSLWH